MPNLQILRFFAAALVLISHVQHEALKLNFFDKSAYKPWEAVFFAGGVDIFFVISGFIIYAIASADFGKSGTASRFFMRRLVRILPPYWLFTTLMILTSMFFSEHITHSALQLDHIIASYFFVPYDNAYGKTYPVLMLGYTLNFEFFFYVCFSAALLFRKTVGLSLLFGVIGLFGALGMLQAVMILPFSFWSNSVVFEFLFGMALAIAREKNLRLAPSLAWSSILSGLAAMVILKRLDIVGHYWNFRILWMGLPALAICAGVVLARDKHEVLSPFRRLLVMLGDASYAIYLSHPFSLNAVAVLWGHVGLHSAWSYVLFASTVSLLGGIAVHLLIEKPMTKYLNRGLEKHFVRWWDMPVARPLS